MHVRGYVDGLLRAVATLRALAAAGRGSGQDDGGPEALDQAADAIVAEADREDTPAAGTRLVYLCSGCQQEGKSICLACHAVRITAP